MMSGVKCSRFAASPLAPAAISRSALSRSSRYTAQCSAVAPSICGALTSAFWRSSVLSAALSPFMTASATSLRPAAWATAAGPSIDATRANTKRFINSSPRTPGSQLREPVRAVALQVLVNPVHVEHAQQQVAGRHRLAIVGEVPVAFQVSIRATDQDVRHVVMLVLIRIAHVRAVHDQRVVEQGAIAVGRCLQLLGEI